MTKASARAMTSNVKSHRDRAGFAGGCTDLGQRLPKEGRDSETPPARAAPSVGLCTNTALGGAVCQSWLRDYPSVRREMAICGPAASWFLYEEHVRAELQRKPAACFGDNPQIRAFLLEAATQEQQ